MEPTGKELKEQVLEGLSLHYPFKLFTYDEQGFETLKKLQEEAEAIHNFSFYCGLGDCAEIQDYTESINNYIECLASAIAADDTQVRMSAYGILIALRIEAKEYISDVTPDR